MGPIMYLIFEGKGKRKHTITTKITKIINSFEKSSGKIKY
jgi:hypothetical protein